ncbi:MAG: hypothetical protein ABL952_06855 [Pyrinomonadaceae bacterium]
MMRLLVKGTLLSATLLAACVLQTNAQTPKKTPKPMATPPILSGAEIISRADDLTEFEAVKPTPAKTPTNANVNAANIRELNERIKKLEGNQNSTYDEKQKRMLLNLDILTRAEQRSDSLRKQLFEMIEKENAVKTRIDQLNNDIRPEMIERTLQLAGSMKPEDIRENRRKSIAAERSNLESLLMEIVNNKANVAVTLQKSDQLVEKLRLKLEKDIDDALTDPPVDK